MTKPSRSIVAVALCGLVAATASGCGNSTDFTSAKMDTDIAHTYGNLLGVQQAAEGHPLSASPTASARCGRAGALTGSSGAGKDWRCIITAHVAGRTTRSPYDVVARPTACYTATSPDFDIQFIRTPTGTQIDNPLYQFDGCLPG